jgi:hypothetical protein
VHVKGELRRGKEKEGTKRSSNTSFKFAKHNIAFFLTTIGEY